jgi:hypothetical protein
MRRWGWLLIFVVGCTSAWDRHRARLAEHESQRNYAAAVADARWMVDNAFSQAPASEHTPAGDAARYLRLADVATQAEMPRVALDALRDALTADPSQAPAVHARIARLPLPAAERDRIQREFAWNIAALAPADDTFVGAHDDRPQCWSYRVREVQLRVRRTVKTPGGMERQVTYDSRPWVFDAARQRWNADGEWVTDAGTEVEPVDGPARPRYRALTAADHHFYADERVPPCHQAAWQGPYDTNGTVFVAAQLPPTPSASPR